MSVATRFLLVLGLAACATGGSGQPDSGGNNGPDAATPKDGPKPDGPGTPPADSMMPPVDSMMPPADAMVPPDSPSSLFCTNNAMCTTPGECCVTLGGPMGFCAPGDVVFGVCFPN